MGWIVLKDALIYLFKFLAIMGVIVWALTQCTPERLEPNTVAVDTEYYGGIVIEEAKKVLHPTRTCKYIIEHVRTVLTQTYIDSQLGTKCTVESLDSSVQGYYSIHDAYMVSWPGGLAVRIYIVNSSQPFRIKGISTTGELPEWRKLYNASK